MLLKQSTFCLVLVVLLSSALAKWKGCGDTCDNNNQCSNALCSDCVNGICTSGLKCNATCIVDSDCERLRYCYSCTAGRCSPGPLYPIECPICKTDADCPKQGCTKCIGDEPEAPKRCVAGCGVTCEHNYECGYDTPCSYCDEQTKKCAKGGPCGTRCGNDGDCDSSSNCHTCIDFTCSVPCAKKCSDSSQCNGPITGCGICKGGVCSPGTECGSRCVYDRDCPPTCNNCNQGICSGTKCNSTCKVNTDCLGAEPCSSCTDGKCGVAVCGSNCDGDQDCGNAGECKSCLNGKCNVLQCGSHCSKDTDCNGAKGGCTSCLNGKCGVRGCGSPCQTNLQCENTDSNCKMCKDGVCTPSIPPDQCDLHRPCISGNNNMCPMDTCSRCDPYTNTCRLGGPCGAACIVNTDCDQTGSCRFCKNICVKTTLEEDKMVAN